MSAQAPQLVFCMRALTNYLFKVPFSTVLLFGVELENQKLILGSIIACSTPEEAPEATGTKSSMRKRSVL